MSLTTRSLIGLSSGALIGAAITATHNAFLQRLVFIIEPVASIWVNALRMTVIPLVFSLLIVGVASAADAGSVRRIGVKAILFFILILFVAASFTALVTPPLLNQLTVDLSTSETLRSSIDAAAVESATKVRTVTQRLVDLVPVNPINSAAGGDVLPLIVFALFFGFAIRRVSPEGRLTLVSFFRGVSEAMLVIVRWVLWLAPVGVFALVLPLTMRAGMKVVGALAYYVVLVSALAVTVTLALYPVAAFWARVPLRRFMRASAPAQAVALSTQSSLASLPAMIEGAERRLELPPQITSLVLPLAVSVFRICNPMAQTCGALFIARLYNIELSATQVVTLVATSVFVSMSSVGLPGGVPLLVTLPVTFLAVGLPVEAIGMLLAVDTLPDMFRTTANVTADMTATAVIGQHYAKPAPVVAVSSAA
ncbi:MAG TPA: dicarboxylate/amino acid:cation symporter [Blastocatellia bacterium]|nr:dicarboxylate/amino acid:cation symporter [Blastocatellia bacterium]